MLNERAKIIGRISRETGRLGLQYTSLLGRQFNLAGSKMEVSNEVYIDVNNPHMIVVCGKRGYGKSYTLGVLVEGLANLDEEIRRNLAVVIVDSMGIFWSLQVPNNGQEAALKEWGLQPKGFNVSVYYPEGLKEKYSKYPQYFHEGFILYPSELNLEDWIYIFNMDETQAQTGLLAKVLANAYDEYGSFYSLKDLIKLTNNSDERENIKNALLRKLISAQGWGIFSDKGKRIEEVVQPGKIIVLDFSGAGELPWNVRTSLTAILIRKIYSKRAFARSEEEIERLKKGKMSLKGVPLTWLVLDEAHLFVPAERDTVATDPLLTWVRQGRYPGLSLLLATQQPGALDPRILSQCDILVIHRVTAGNDSAAIEKRISEIYGSKSMGFYMKALPKEPGYAIVMDDKTEEIIPVSIRPRQSWHAGESAKLEEYVGS
jgi:hypothetical protein